MIEAPLELFVSNAPVFTVDGDIVRDMARDLLRLDVEEGTLGLRTLVARLHPVGPDSDGSADQLSYLGGRHVKLGSEIEVEIGPDSGARRIFRGTVSAIEIQFDEGEIPFVSVFAEDALMRLRMRERTTTYRNLTDAQIADQIAAEHGLASSADADGPRYPVVQQWEQTDLAFLRDRANRVNAEIWLDGDGALRFGDRTQRPAASLTLVQGGDLISVTARVDLAHQRSTVEYGGWDNELAQRVSDTSGPEVVSAEVEGGWIGPDAVRQVFGDTPLRRSRRDVLAADTATAYARAEMRRRARRFVTVHGTTAGTPDLVPGAHLELLRVGRPFEGSGYRVSDAHHSFDLVDGYRTHFTAERPAVNP